ncbi:Acyltransferase family protein [Bacteroidales bacterium KHT7]|nr:Acyltransferase family protein [Bacteroidales bacterium KHT7]
MKRIEYIDALRGFAIFLMVVGHVIPNLYLNKQIILPNLQTWIYAFHMPLFFTISGYFIYRDSKITAKEAMNQIYKKMIIRNIPQCIIFAIEKIIVK